LSLPNGGYHEDAIRTDPFLHHIYGHVSSWFTWAQNNVLGVERMEDLILVTGCTLVTSWAIAMSMDDTMETEISLASRIPFGIPSNNGASFDWSNVRGPVLYRNSVFETVRSPSYVSLAYPDFFFDMESQIHGDHPGIMINAYSSGAFE